jgi:hypothetical protein
LHLRHRLFAEILQELARKAKAMPIDDEAHRTSLADAPALLHNALTGKSG